MQHNLTSSVPDAPVGWVPLARAFDWFGLAALGNGWHPLYVEAPHKAAALEGGTEKPPTLDGDIINGRIRIDLTSDVAARLFVPTICRSFASAVRAGRLRAGYAAKGAGERHDMPVGAWRTDNPLIRFQGWGFDPDNEGATGDDLPCWVFVHADDLAALRLELEAWRKALPVGSLDTIPVGGANVLCDTTLEADWPLPFFIMPAIQKLYPGAPMLPDFEKAKAIPDNAAQPENDNPAPARKVQTRPKPNWYPMLLEEMRKADKRLQDFQAAHPDKLPPLFPPASKFKTKLMERGVPASMLGDRNVRYHVGKIKEELGR